MIKFDIWLLLEEKEHDAMLKHLILLSFLAIFATALILEIDLVFATSAKSSDETKPFSLKPRSAMPKYDDKGMITISLGPNGTRVVQIPPDKLLVKLELRFEDPNNTQRITNVIMHPNSDLNALYDTLSAPKSKKIAFIYPMFTQAAYSKNGFYDYYLKKCDSTCLTVKIPTQFSGGAYASVGGATMLYFLNYELLTDIDVDKNPTILKKYDRIIVLHNEYVTQKEFNAITKHKDVVYLYPNALYALVKSDYKTNTITLQKGHGYPNEKIANGFSWKHDNSKYEYDLQCDGWKFSSIPNGKMLNCNPDYRVFFDKNLLLEIRK